MTIDLSVTSVVKERNFYFINIQKSWKAVFAIRNVKVSIDSVERPRAYQTDTHTEITFKLAYEVLFLVHLNGSQRNRMHQTQFKGEMCDMNEMNVTRAISIDSFLFCPAKQFVGHTHYLFAINVFVRKIYYLYVFPFFIVVFLLCVCSYLCRSAMIFFYHWIIGRNVFRCVFSSCFLSIPCVFGTVVNANSNAKCVTILTINPAHVSTIHFFFVFN